jgi:hypothetical protein
MLTTEWLDRVLNFSTEYHNSRQIFMFWKYLFDIRSEVWLHLFWEYKQGIAARLEFKTVNGAVETRLICSATAASATATAKRKHGRQRPAPDNERRRQMREAWRMKQKSPTAAAATAASTKIAAAKEAAAKEAAATEVAATRAAAMGVVATGVAGMRAAVKEAAATGAVATGAAAAGAAATGAAVMGAAPPAKRLKSAAFASRGSARSAVVSKRREGGLSGRSALESPEKIRGNEEMDEELSFQLEYGEIQREDGEREEEREEEKDEEKEEEREEEDAKKQREEYVKSVHGASEVSLAQSTRVHLFLLLIKKP